MKLHDAISKALLSGWDLKINKQSFLRNMRVIPTNNDRSVLLEARIWTGQRCWTWVVAEVFDNSANVYFYFLTGYGHRDLPEPTFPRETVTVQLPGQLPRDIEKPSPRFPTILNGQATPIKALHYDFVSNAAWWQQAETEFKETAYVPRYGPQTGGLWGYMGYQHTEDLHTSTAVKALHSMCMLGCYGGHFVHRDGARFLTEADEPNVVGGSYLDNRVPDKGWIKYTDPNAPWKDRMAWDIAEADYEHLSVYDAPSEAWIYFKTPAFAMLVIAAAERMLRLIPGRDKGGSFHEAGQHRAQGRVLKTLVKLFRALRAMPGNGSNYLRDQIARRAVERFNIQWRERINNVATNGLGWTLFGKHGDPKLINAHEIGIHYWGLRHLDDELDGMGIHDARVDLYKRECSKLCFNAFMEWPTGEFAPLLGYNPDLTIPENARPTSAHFCWLAAVNHQPETPSEAQKIERIKGLRVDARFTDGIESSAS